MPRRYSVHNVALDVSVATDPWPWAMSQLLLARGPCRELMRAATDITRATKVNADHPLRVALLVHELFAYWRTRPQRMFALTIVKNTLFCEHEQWLDWEPGLLDVSVARRAADPVAHRPSADPADAADAVIVANAKHLPDGSAFRIGRDGSHITLQTGETIAIAGPDRPALRARMAIDGASGTFRHRPLRMRELFSQPCDPDRGLDRQALPQITRMLDMRRLRTRADHDVPCLSLEADAELRDRLAPAVLDYQHAALLSGLLQWLPPRRPYADVLRRGCDEDARLLRDLQRYGLVVAGYEGAARARRLAAVAVVRPARVPRHAQSIATESRDDPVRMARRALRPRGPAPRAMNTIAVIDPCDETRNTAFVNRLSEPRHRRAVVHAPASSEGLLDEILRARSVATTAPRLDCGNAKSGWPRGSARSIASS